jgi:site-specific DNA-methyltransferase (adenine-specific)
MKTLSDKSVDCFICDLPYGQLNKNRQMTDGIKGGCFAEKNGCDWDIKIDLKVFWEQIERLAKSDNTPVIHFCNTKFGIDLINSKPDWFRYDLVWNKGRGVSFLLANKMPMKSHEMIYVFSKTGAYYNRIDETIEGKKGYYKECGRISRQYGVTLINIRKKEDGTRCPLSVINIGSKTVRNGHPTEKPRELYEWLLRRYCPEGGTVLDPTAGSFNSIEVARDLGLKGIGIEMDETFFYKAVEKFDSQLK